MSPRKTKAPVEPVTPSRQRVRGLPGWYGVEDEPGMLYREIRFETRVTALSWWCVLELVKPLLPERLEVVREGEGAGLYLGEPGASTALERERLHAAARWLESLRGCWLELARLRGQGNEAL
jgi:hypothetical protein